MEDKKFELFGSPWTIKYVDEIKEEDGHFWFGLTDYIKKEILIATKDFDGKSLLKSDIEITLLHEVVHAMFLTGNYNDTNNDEPLVEWIARCLKSLLKQKIIK